MTIFIILYLDVAKLIKQNYKTIKYKTKIDCEKALNVILVTYIYRDILAAHHIVPTKVFSLQQQQLIMSGRQYLQKRQSQYGNRDDRGESTANTAPAAASKQNQLNELIGMYMENVLSSNKKSNDSLEMEVRFGTGGVRAITHRDHANVIDRLLSAGFKATSTGNYHLRINYEKLSGGAEDMPPQTSNIRFEIDGMTNIQNYCATDALDLTHLKCTRKTNARFNDAYVKPIKFDDFNFKVSLQNERTMRHESAEVDSIIKGWPQIKKTFRHMKRTSFAHPESPIRVDISVVKESKRHPPPNTWRMESTYTFEQANVADSSSKYEIEIEIDNSRVGPGKFVDSSEALAFLVRQAIKLVLSGLQGTNFPVSYYPEIQSVCNDYHYLLHHAAPESSREDSDEENDEKALRSLAAAAGDYRNKDNKRLTTRNFIGPSSVTLQRCNISSTFTRDRSTGIPNIRFNYTVTDKADGQRKMLFINRIGRVYLIDTAMNVQFTGMVCKDEKLHWSLLDGEHILHDKTGNFINLYAAFDIYFMRKMDIRHLAFAFQHDDAISNSTKFRMFYLREFMTDVANTFQSVVPVAEYGVTPPMRMIAKRFRVAGKRDPNEIFKCCQDILTQINDGLFAYNTDGLIFTPADTGVGMSRVGGIAPRERSTWPMSFKWKPANHNTIDFLITTEKREDRHEIIHEKPGITTCDDSPVIKYKTLTLRVGYSSERDGYLNPMQTVLDGTVANTTAPLPDDPPSAAVPFYPTMPPDTTAHICNIVLQNVDGVYQMRAESGDAFTDKSVVEFRYDMSREPGFKWVPIKVRHDKTLARELGNSFHVANDNWFSIHYPVTEAMLVSETNIDEVIDTGVYYQKTVSSQSVSGKRRLIDLSSSQPLRDFHNLYVKRELLFGVCKPGKTLIDLAVGKGGDIQKWIEAKLHFVFGLDVSEDNVINSYDGAYARCVKYAEKTPLDKGDKFPFMVFARGDSGKLIRSRTHSLTESGNAFMKTSSSSSSSSNDTSMYKAIADTVFGEGQHDPKIVGRELMKYHGIGRDGFDVCSVQFAVHYFWKDIETLHTFMRNVSECTKDGGYFVGTCFDGRRMFDMLQKYTTTYPMVYEDDAPPDKRRVILSVMKKYDKAEYHDDETSIGYAIDVFQESINSTHTEYLVNMVYLERLMRNYGFALVQRDVAKRDLLLPSGMGSFSELYEMMCMDMSYNIRGREGEMTETLKTISFMNSYFAFQKVQQVDAKRISEAFIKNNGIELVAADAAANSDNVNDVKPPSAAIIEKTRKRIDGVDYMMDERGNLFKPTDMITSIGEFDAKRKEINFVSESLAENHRTQKAVVAEKKRLKLEAVVVQKQAKAESGYSDKAEDVIKNESSTPIKLNPKPKAAKDNDDKPPAKPRNKSSKTQPVGDVGK